jgi:carboxyl-terminal processing protease
MEPTSMKPLYIALLSVVIAGPGLEAQACDAQFQDLQAAYHLIKSTYVHPVSDRRLEEGALQGMQASLPAGTATGTEATGTFIQRFCRAYGRARAANSSVAPEAVEAGAIRGMIASLRDPAVAYLPPPAAKAAAINNLEYAGIGIQLGRSRDSLWVLDVFEGGPASTAGIEADDRIIAINGQPASTMAIEEAVTAIRGPNGTTVSLTIARGKAPERTLSVTRGPIEMSELRDVQLFGEVLYFRLASFNANHAPRHIGEVLAGHPNASALIIDLRMCAGGKFENVSQITGLFSEKGPLFYLKGRAGTKPVASIKEQVVYPAQKPLAVLVDETTKSGAEMLAAGLRASRGALIFGSTTAGFGYIQTARELPGHGFLLLPNEEIWLTSGDRLEGNGIQPDVKTPPVEGEFRGIPGGRLPKVVTREEAENARDRPLERTLEYLTTGGVRM